jgi:tRNA modification GTPase
MQRSFDDTIAAISTPVGEGGIGIVRLSGTRAVEIAGKVFISKNGKKTEIFKSHTVRYGYVCDRDKIIDEALLTVMRAPKSYTKEDVVEINCHGGIQATKKALDLLLKRGARLAEPGEFTKRAFLNGRLDLSQAEAVLDTIRAKTDGSLRVAIGQLEGGLSKKVNAVIDKLSDITAEVEASIDFPEEDIEIKDRKRILSGVVSAASDIKAMIDSYGNGAVMREGILAIICGKPNVGKSSLMNILLKRDRVIVSPIPGTTRDAVEEMISIDGIPVRLVDTAGIGVSGDPLGGKSEDKTKAYLDLADIALMVIDGSRKLDGRDFAISKLIGAKKKIVVINKTDLGCKVVARDLKKLSKPFAPVKISAVKGVNIKGLENRIASLVWDGSCGHAESAVVSNARHKELLDKSYGCVISVVKAIKKKFHPELVAVDLKEAISSLGSITGRSVSDDILDRIFNKFCIGK